MIETDKSNICINNNEPIATTAVTSTNKTFHSGIAKLTENSIAVSLTRPFWRLSFNSYLFRLQCVLDFGILISRIYIDRIKVITK